MTIRNIIVASILFLPFSSCEEVDGPPPTIVEESYKHIRAVWSPDGLTIAFTVIVGSAPGIYAVDSSGANMRLVKPGEGIGLTWSPDSRWIGLSASGSLYKILATGDSLTRLTTSASDQRPSWSPNDSMMAFRSSGLKILNLRTGLVTSVLNYGDFPSWHPNGTQVVFMNSASAGSGRWYYDFNVVTIATSQVSFYYTFQSSTDCGFSSMSPTGTEIVFSSKPLNGTGYAQVVRLEIAQSQLIQVTFDGGDYPAWNPAGTAIVYTRTAKDDGGLWVMNKDGSGKRKLTTP